MLTYNWMCMSLYYHRVDSFTNNFIELLNIKLYIISSKFLELEVIVFNKWIDVTPLWIYL